ncbi:MAG: Lrp/AsnC family transcriptional regulator [Alphaproteobacteria bacterium]|jgi:Lrp/AsnC family transcriptional regulator|nr:Lrp/AsnC family transcriptional regulator [Alphaproteobacteria bacterium]PHX99456.1 MAG: ArsR family transcriptional regulator [Rhodospirillaceae bacterium]
MNSLDEKDRKILEILQENALTPVAEIAAKVGLSTTPCWRRIQKLEEEGVIRKRVALLDRHKLNVGVTVFVAVKAKRHAMEWLNEFKRAVETIPEIVEAYRLSGEVDYLLRVVVPDIKAYDEVYKRLIEKVEFTDVSSSFAMEDMKFTTTLPLKYLVG